MLSPSNNDLQRISPWWLALAMAVMMLLFCITTLFNTKGEPREAIVAVSMLQSGDWILPASFGGDEIPYKPPFLAWCIALTSLIFGGHVTEFSARFPSLIAAMLMVVATASFFTRYGQKGKMAAWMAAWVTVTSFEVFRAATACRVDMVLTAFMVGGMYSMYGWFASSRPNSRSMLPWLAIVLMSGAFLTKGPVGVFLPCLAIGVYRLTCGDRFWPLLLRMVAIGVCSLVIPAMWYVAAYINGGERFVELVLEENVGRMTGSMSYESHENGAYYNFVTLAAGMVPYTLLALMALTVVRWRGLWGRIASYARARFPMEPVSAFATIAALVIFIFYCIPKSKRSVYLLPMYPFVAWGVVAMMQWLAATRMGRGVIRWFTYILGGLALLLPLAWVALKFGAGNSIKAVAYFNEFQPVGMTIVSAFIAPASILIGLWVIRGVAGRKFITENMGIRSCLPAALALFAAYTMLDNAVLPPILSAKTDRGAAEQIAELQPEGDIWSYVATPMMRYYTANFYLDDRLRQIPALRPDQLPAAGSLIVVGDKDIDHLKAPAGMKLTEVWRSPRRSCDTRQNIVVVRLDRAPSGQ